MIALNNIGEALSSGTIGNLMQRSGPGPEEFAYQEQPLAFVFMFFMWLLAGGTGLWMAWTSWFGKNSGA
jgi:hypothetical protein